MNWREEMGDDVRSLQDRARRAEARETNLINGIERVINNPMVLPESYMDWPDWARDLVGMVASNRRSHTFDRLEPTPLPPPAETLEDR